MASPEPVLLDMASNGVATISLNSPETRNAFSAELMAGLLDALVSAGRNGSVGCVVLTSTHPSVFSAGGNLRRFAGSESLVQQHLANTGFPQLVETIGLLRVPVICALNGHALAGALGLMLACDLVIAKAGARVGTPEINVGVFPFMISALMQRNMPRKRLAEMVFLGEQMSAEEARDAGFVNLVVPEEAFQETVKSWAEKIARKSPLMLRLGKQALFQQQDLPLREAVAFLQHFLTLALSTEDVKEGVAAFREKREPVWKGR
jgi:enoyl-CoA hydratase/carnithine racemase